MSDALGNRVVKENPKRKVKEVYVRDAQGNILALYQVKNDSLYTKEFYMYGSQRLGYLEDEVFMGKKCIGKFCNIVVNLVNPMPFIGTQKTLPTLPPVVIQPISSSSVSIVFGKKRYELSDWLGNVRVVINDRKTPINSGNATVGYKAQVVSVNDYYSFGSEINDRTYTYNTPYRFSFNGKEDIREQRWYQDYGARWYNKVLGRFISPDPLIVGQKKYAWLSGYQFAGDMPIKFIDIDGLEPGYYDKNRWVTQGDVLQRNPTSEEVKKITEQYPPVGNPRMVGLKEVALIAGVASLGAFAVGSGMLIFGVGLESGSMMAGAETMFAISEVAGYIELGVNVYNDLNDKGIKEGSKTFFIGGSFIGLSKTSGYLINESKHLFQNEKKLINLILDMNLKTSEKIVDEVRDKENKSEINKESKKEITDKQQLIKKDNEQNKDKQNNKKLKNK
jgi:RHS repeat-associated protein